MSKTKSKQSTTQVAVAAQVDPRVAILQDMVTREQEKRRKTEAHIVNLNTMVKMISMGSSVVINDCANRIQNKAEEFVRLQQQVTMARAERDQFIDQWQESQSDLEAANHKLAAVMQTLKTMSEAVDFA